MPPRRRGRPGPRPRLPRLLAAVLPVLLHPALAAAAAAAAAAGPGGGWGAHLPVLWPQPRRAASDGTTLGLARGGAQPLGIVCATEAACSEAVLQAWDRTNLNLRNPAETPSTCLPVGAGAGRRAGAALADAARPPTPAARLVPAGAALGNCSVAVRSADETLRMGVDESYNLTVSAAAGCRISAETVYGALHALETLSQLCVFDPDQGYAMGIALVQAEIRDAPRFPFRGFLLDTARHFLPVPTVLDVVDALALHKMNVLHWHLVDSQAFPVRSELFPELAEKGAYDPLATYSKADLRAVVAYAKSRGVRVMPEFDVPGHGSWGAGRPELMGCADVLDPTKPEVYDFLKAFLGEMAAVFEDEYLFLGGDEVNTTCWDDNPGIAKWMKQRGLNSTQLFSYFWNRTSAEVLPGLGKKVGVWEADDVAVDMALLPADSFANTWTSNTSWGNVTEKGFPVVISGPYYLDQENPGGCAQYRWDQTWKCFYFAEPLEYLGAAARGLVRGKLAALWGEAVSSRNIESRAWPRASAIAERMWSPDWTNATRPAEDAVQQRLERHVCRLNKRGLAAGPVGPQFCPTDLDPAPKRPGGRGAARAEF